MSIVSRPTLRHTRCRPGPFMTSTRYLSVLAVFLVLTCAPRPSFAQTPAAADAPPLWDAQVGASFVGTSGNSDTASTGADFSAHRRSMIWKLDAGATLVRTSTDGEATAERYLASFRADRRLTSRIGLTSGAKAGARSIRRTGHAVGARRRFELGPRPASGVDARRGEQPRLAARVAHHRRRCGRSHRRAAAPEPHCRSVAPATRRSDSPTYPNLKTAAAYRYEAEITAQAAMTGHLALEIGYSPPVSRTTPCPASRTPTTRRRRRSSSDGRPPPRHRHP